MVGFQLEQFAKSLQEILSMLVLLGFLLHTREVYEFVARTVLRRSSVILSKHTYKISRRREEEEGGGGGDDLCLQPTLDFTEASSEDQDDDYLHIIPSAERLRIPPNVSEDRKISERQYASPKKQRLRQFDSFEIIPEESNSTGSTSPASQDDADVETNLSSIEDTTEAASEYSDITVVKGNNTSTNSPDKSAFSFYESQALSGRRRAVPMAALKSRLAWARPPDHLSHAYAVSTSSLLKSFQKQGGRSHSLRPSSLISGSSQPTMGRSLSRSTMRRGLSLSHLEDSGEALQRQLPGRRNSDFKHKSQDARLLNRIVRSIHAEQSEGSHKNQAPRSPEYSLLPSHS